MGFNELSGTKVFSTFLTKDVSFMLNLTGGVQNDFLAEETTQIAPGIQFALNLPGTVNVGITAYKEWSYNTFDACGPAGFGVAKPLAYVGGACARRVAAVHFSGNRELRVDLETLHLHFRALLPAGTAGHLGQHSQRHRPQGHRHFGRERGRDLRRLLRLLPSAFANAETKTEVFEDTRLSLDASKVFWGKPGIWDTYVGYRYWYNKFGTDHHGRLPLCFWQTDRPRNLD